MRYSCEQIKLILEIDQEYGIDFIQFEDHILRCGKCRSLTELQPELEENLSASTSRPAPDIIYGNVMNSIKKIENINQQRKPLSYYFYLSVLATTSIVLSIVGLKWTFISELISDISFINILAKANEFIASLDTSAKVLNDINIFISSSPAIIWALMLSSAVVWSFSFIAYQKAIK